MRRIKFILSCMCCLFFLGCGKNDPVTSILATKLSTREISESIKRGDKEFATLNEIVTSFFNGTALLISEGSEGLNQITLEDGFIRLYPLMGGEEDFTFNFKDELVDRLIEEGVKSKKNSSIIWYVEKVEDGVVVIGATNEKVKISIPVDFHEDGESFSIDVKKIHGIEFYKGRYLDIETLETLSYINHKLNR